MKIKTQLRITMISFFAAFFIVCAVFLFLLNLIKKCQDSKKILLVSFILCLALTLICIYLFIHFSITLNKSINYLQKATKRLADGDVSKSLERRKNSRGSNEITDLIVNLEKMRHSLKDEIKRKERFIMGMSHDLRTPVAVIKGYSEAILDEVVTKKEDIMKSVDTILLKSNQLENMINTLINFVKMENSNWSGNKILQPIECVLTEFLNNSKNTGEIFKKTVSGSINVNKETKILFDKDLLLRALENLFSNALRYTKENNSIFINATENENQIEISISDTGIGIKAEDIQFIFDFLYRGTSSRREAGFGIGLSVVKNIVDTHGWKIDVKSKENEGTTFTIMIPKTDLKA